MLTREEFLQPGQNPKRRFALPGGLLKGLRPGLARLLFSARELIRSLADGPPGLRRSVLYETHLDVDPEAAASILHSVGHSFPLRVAGLRLTARAAGEPGPRRGFSLSLYISAEGWRERLWLWPQTIQNRAREKLRGIAARIQLYAWTGEHTEYAFAPDEYAGGRWLSELYPSLRPAAFQNNSLRAGRWNPFASGDRWHAALQEQQQHPCRRRRRVLLLPIRARQSDLAGLLPPPLQARWRVRPEAGGHTGVDADIRLYLRVFLDGGPLNAPMLRAQHTSSGRGSAAATLEGELDPPEGFRDLSDWEPARAAGTERSLYMELLCPAMLHADALRTRGWVPVFARSIPLDQPVLPLRQWNEFTASYRVRSDGFRFCLGDERRRLQAVAQGRPLRGLRRGERPPRLARVPGHIFIQSPENLDVRVFRENSTVPANRIYILHRGGTAAGQSFADWFSRRLGIAFTAEDHGWFLSYADVESRLIAQLPLTECHYRPGVHIGPLPR